MPGSEVTLLFDGLEIIYFRPDGGRLAGTVLLLQRDDHTPSIDILKITETEVIPVNHDLDISEGINIALDTVQGVDKRYIGPVLNLQGSDFHDSNLRFRRGLLNPPIKVTVRDGTFFTAFTNPKFPTRFEVHNPPLAPDRHIDPFADVVGVNITIPDGSNISIGGQILRSEPRTRYSVLIKNGPAPGHQHMLNPHPNKREKTHFYFYYDVLEDIRDTGSNAPYQFDLEPPPPVLPPENCDPVYLDPPPPNDP